mgnify:CR=1 FL=1
MCRDGAAVEPLHGSIGSASRPDGRRIVDHNVDATKGLDCESHGLVHRLVVANVAHDREALASGLVDTLRRRVDLHAPPMDQRLDRAASRWLAGWLAGWIRCQGASDAARRSWRRWRHELHREHSCHSRINEPPFALVGGQRTTYRRAMASPIPREAPVMKILFPLRDARRDMAMKEAAAAATSRQTNNNPASNDQQWIQCCWMDGSSLGHRSIDWLVYYNKRICDWSLGDGEGGWSTTAGAF